jgi:predicted protein tyrosine phosphatase
MGVILTLTTKERSNTRKQVPATVFGGAAGKKSVTLYIEDVYQFMQPESVDELKAKVGQFVELGD